jgi:NAD-dependent deacetylase
LFGESLPAEALRTAESQIARADLVLVIGSSLQVYPANQLPQLCKGTKVLINAEPVAGHAGNFDWFIEGRAGGVLAAAERALL